LGKENEDEDLVVHRQRAPYYGQEEGCGGRYEAEEEDENGGVLVVHKVVAQLGATVGNAAIGKVEVEAAEGGGDVDDEEAVEEAYGCFSGQC
jgi:hypothetical protein